MRKFKKIIALLTAIVMVLGYTNIVGAESDRMLSTANYTFKEFTTVYKRAKIEFDLCVNTISDGFVGIAASSVTPTYYTDYSICITVRKDQHFEAYNGSAFDKENTISIIKDKTYHITIDADITNQIYDAYVEFDGEKLLLADGYGFRAPADELGKITCRGGEGVAGGFYYIENIKFIQGEGELETLKLPNFFMENMVLQRNQPIKIYGKSNAEKVTVELKNNKNGEIQRSGEAASENGEFTVQLDALDGSLDPYTLTVSTPTKKITINNVFIGDVFLLAGQSNMEQRYDYAKNQLGNGVTADKLPKGLVDDRIKFFTLAMQYSSYETLDVPFLNGRGWESLTSENNHALSYIGMYFAQERLKAEPNVPVGLMSAAWGGSGLSRWLRVCDENKGIEFSPNGTIYNNHVAPLTNYPISAVLWYQGESNSSNPVGYEEGFKALINDYKQLWGRDNLPFLFVQLARYSGDNYQYMREVQLKALELPATGMVVSIDTDENTYGNIHPLGKPEIARRLYLLSKKYVDGDENAVVQSPVYESSRIEGNKIIISFRDDTIGEGLELKNVYGNTSDKLNEFEISGKDGVYVPANAEINSDNTVSIWSAAVPEPVAARYAFSKVPSNPNLFNKNGLPVSPFITDTRLFNSANFVTKGFDIDNSDYQMATFKVTPVKDKIDGIISFTAKENTVSNWPNCSVTLKLQTDGHFGYVDGGSFKTSSVPYKAGETYDVTVVCDFKSKRYAASVNGTPICTGSAFRSGSLEMKNMGRFLIRGGEKVSAGVFYVDKYPTIEQVEGGGQSERMISSADFSYRSFEPVDGRVNIEFDLCANTVSEGIVGIAASDVEPNDYSQYPIWIGIRDGRYFDAYNGTGYDKVNIVNYEPGKKYHIIIDADTESQLYDAYVEVDGERKIIASNYSFRTQAYDFGKITCRGGGGVAGGLYYIENISVKQVQGALNTLRLPNFFMENMVLQRNQPIKIFGKTNAEKVQVVLNNGKTELKGEAACENGEFTVQLDALEGSLEPYTLTVYTPFKSVTINNVFIGDVFLLAGQSNMEQSYNHAIYQTGGGVTKDKLPQRVVDSRIKHFTLSTATSDFETFDVPFLNGVGWQELTEGNNKTLSHIGMLFAKNRLEEHPDIPIGLMSVAYGGSIITSWTRRSDDNKTVDYTPSGGEIYNNHVAPLTKYPISAILWYQGETDAKNNNHIAYEQMFKNLITDYRKLWGRDDLPFMYVQLARYSAVNYSYLRNAQMNALSLDNTGMAVILDTDKGTYTNNHPLGKEEVARRLYLLSKKLVDGQDVVVQSPVYDSYTIEGNKITVSFRADTIGEGLCMNNVYGNTDNSLCEFEISGKNGIYVQANAVINDDNTVTVWADSVSEPVAVRYAYSAVPRNPNLFNKNGLPASPFTTDTRIFSEASFATRGSEIENSDVQIASFQIVPLMDNLNGVFGFTDKDNTVTWWDNCAVTLKLAESGYFEYYDGTEFKPGTISYKAGNNYDFTVICDFTDKTYSAIVNDEVLCENAAFRDGSLPMSNMGRFYIRGGESWSAGDFMAPEYPKVTQGSENFTITASNGDNDVVFAVKPTCNIFVANYSGSKLESVARMKRSDGLESMATDSKDYKVLKWDDNMRPIE